VSNLQDKVVIDIAGLPNPLTTELLTMGVKEVHGVNIVPLPAPGNTAPSRYFHHVGDARDLPISVPFADMIIACSALEHLPDLSDCLKSALSKLRSGGILVMHGGPLWPRKQGHHIWLEREGQNYFFGTATDPIPAWGHLSYKEMDFENMLVEKGINPSHCSAICEKVYHGSSINRQSVTQIKSDFQNTRQLAVGFTEYHWGVPDLQQFEKIAALGHTYSESDLMTGEVVGVIRKF